MGEEGLASFCHDDVICISFQQLFIVLDGANSVFYGILLHVKTCMAAVGMLYSDWGKPEEPNAIQDRLLITVHKTIKVCRFGLCTTLTTTYTYTTHGCVSHNMYGHYIYVCLRLILTGTHFSKFSEECHNLSLRRIVSMNKNVW